MLGKFGTLGLGTGLFEAKSYITPACPDLHWMQGAAIRCDQTTDRTRTVL